MRTLLLDAGVTELQGFRHRKPHVVPVADSPQPVDLHQDGA
jgi:hypothetical protein